MKDEDKIKKIKELNELLNVPGLDVHLLLEMEISKTRYREQIEAYRGLKNRFRESGNGRMRLIESKSPSHFQQSYYYFELNRTRSRGKKGGFKWVVEKIEPKPHTGVEKIIPPEFLQVLEVQAVDEQKMEVRERFKSEELQKYFDISFTKQSNNHAFGKISESVSEAQVDSSEEENEIVKVQFLDEQIKKEKDYMELFHYMEEHPEIKMQIFSLFSLLQKPRAHKKPVLKFEPL